ncbi:bacteriocin biosynthesis docking scaffold, SagD family [Streptomyces netropsis]|uniref:Ribosomal protein S12 methylthiotransferase accessory factor n=1 Tax=Streptomyces syringium TaxID=76729 RepID=A0ABS4YD66_9ACTN|nr:TOMM precursor leader peptide-binding protein [Streptomyces syringium]MBP2406733.1 ribosomal protein S12 methylthiotransferase accessory factor [Streptomyces syringium]SPE61800.1 bacteriocin biosynthesis docking scaffold, SagD family [Streptomyces netropsis]
MSTDAPTPAPLEEAGRHLRRALTARFDARPEGAASHPPVVVPLGAADAFRPERDPYGAARGGANVHLTAQAVLIGPWGATDAATAACGGCLARRWQRLRSRSERDALEVGTAPHPVGDWPALPDFAVDAVWAVYEAVLHSGRPVAAGRPAGDWHTAADLPLPQVSRVDLATLRVTTLPLLAEPQCPYCPPPASAAPAASEAARALLRSRPKPAPDRYRLRPARSYPMPTGALANPVCGALGEGTWLNVTSPTTAPVAGSVFVRTYAGLSDVTWSGQANSFAASRDLAFLEGLERYAGIHRRRDGQVVEDSYDGLRSRGEHAVDPRECGTYAPQTYRDDPMVAPFDPARTIPWVRGHSLRDERPVWVPTRLVHYGAGLASDNFVFESSNGCATGSCPEEAVLFGLLELIERDAFLLAWYGRARLTEIDLDSCRSEAVRAMTARAALQGYDVHAFDNRVDLAVPVVTGLAVRRDGGPGTLSFAAGARLDPEDAVEAALSEVLSYIPHLDRQVEEDRAELEAMARDFSRVRHLTHHARLFGLPEMAAHAREYLEPVAVRPLGDVYRDWQSVRPRSGDLRDDVLLCRDELVRAGFDVIVVDQTSPEQERMGLTTVSTVVPGLLPIDFGWSRQRAPRMPRMRSAFRRAGWRSTDLTDDELRMVPHPFP